MTPRNFNLLYNNLLQHLLCLPLYGKMTFFISATPNYFNGVMALTKLKKTASTYAVFSKRQC